MRITEIGRKIIIFGIIMFIFFLSLFLSFYNKEITIPSNYYNYSGSYEGIVEMEKNSIDGEYYLTVSDFYPIEDEFSTYLSQFENPKDAFKYIIITKNTYIFDNRTNPGKMLYVDDMNEIVLEAKDYLEFKIYITERPEGPFLIAKVLDIFSSKNISN